MYRVDSLLPDNEPNPEGYTAMSKNNVIELSGRDQFADALTDLLRTGARQLIQQAVEAELAEFMTQYTDRFLDIGRTVVVRNGYQPERESRPALGRSRSSYRKYGPKMGKRWPFVQPWFRLMCAKRVFWKRHCPERNLDGRNGQRPGSLGGHSVWHPPLSGHCRPHRFRIRLP